MKNTATTLTVITFMFLALAGCSTPAPPASDFYALQGSWQGSEVGGKEGTCYLIVSGNSLEFRGADPKDWCKATYSLREDTNPKQLIAVISNGPMLQDVGKKVHAIYRIENGTLRLAGSEVGNPVAPASFEAPGARKFVLKKP